MQYSCVLTHWHHKFSLMLARYDESYFSCWSLHHLSFFWVGLTTMAGCIVWIVYSPDKMRFELKDLLKDLLDVCTSFDKMATEKTAEQDVVEA